MVRPKGERERWKKSCPYLQSQMTKFFSTFIVQLLSHVHSTLCDPMDCSTPGFPVLHYLSEFVQTYDHWVGDAIRPSHPLSPSSPTPLDFSQLQGLSTFILILMLRWKSRSLLKSCCCCIFLNKFKWFLLPILKLKNIGGNKKTQTVPNGHLSFDSQRFLF